MMTPSRPAAIFVALAAVLSAGGVGGGCDGTPVRLGGAAGSISAPGGSNASGGVGGGGGAPVGEGGGPGGPGGATQPPPLTECGLVREIPIANSALVQTDALYVTRAGDGFVLQGFSGGNVAPMVTFAFVRPDGDKEGLTAAPLPAKAYAWGLAGKARAGDQFLMFTSDDTGVPPDTHVIARALDTGAEVFGPERPLFQVDVTNQTGQASSDVAWDGLRSVFAIGSPSVGRPVAALIGADGKLLGQALTIATTAKDFGWRQLDVIGTEHGGAVSVMDDLDGQPRWHLAELDAAGAVVFDDAFALPAPIVGAPRLIRPTPRGFVAVFAGVGHEGATLVEVDRPSAASPVPVLLRVSPLGFDADVVAMAALDNDVLVQLDVLSITVLRIVRIRPAGPDPEVKLMLSHPEFRPSWIPGEHGGLSFVYRTGFGLSIVKVACPP